MNMLEDCLRLSEKYEEEYRAVKDKLLTNPKARQFDFNEAQIFGKFDLFCRRLIKLTDIFSTIYQVMRRPTVPPSPSPLRVVRTHLALSPHPAPFNFHCSVQYKSIVEHKVEGMDNVIVQFNQIVNALRMRNHDLLNFSDQMFDREYANFNIKVSGLEELLQKFINRVSALKSFCLGR